ncbi:hypothetical protein BCR35DRAFT_330764 [Leucosporidium creatinivorum]|uniref:Uncharacterized protein n=1 Tax=Leucosporidium creatinivorum TaxID=106004 RepID=A0A1Y2FQ63_9BASI|nr:hypothetical protein BCR35DRAFT_330764 [Leucosporidium creatinivorum]
MCRSSATLFYGVWVRSWSLAFAADAYDKIQPTLLAIDLIARRWRDGKLEVEEQERNTTARDLPGEVWELVKQELIDFALAEQAAVHLAYYRCPSCTHALGQSTEDKTRQYQVLRTEAWEIKDVWTSWDDLRCKRCIKWVGGSPFYWMQEPGRSRKVNRLLSSFGLCMPSVVPYKEDSQKIESPELSPVALKLESSLSGRFPEVDTDLCRQEFSNCATSNTYAFEASALSLPADVDYRFRRLIQTYRLRVVDPTMSTIVPLSELQPPSSDISATRQTTAEQEEPFAEAEPRWMLWSFASVCW